MFKPGDIINKTYSILGVMEEDDFGISYLATNEELNRIYALQEYRLSDSTSSQKRELIRSISPLLDINHSYIENPCEITETAHGLIVIRKFSSKNIMENKPTSEDIFYWFIQLCEALGYLHSRFPQMILKGLTPKNVVFHPDGTVSLCHIERLLDNILFEKMIEADPDAIHYLAPESRGGKHPYSQTSAIYSLGAVMYELSAGQPPQPNPESEDLSNLYNRNFSLRYVIKKCLQQNPAQRYQSFAELMYDLRFQVNPQLNPYAYCAPPPSTPIEMIKEYRRKKRCSKFVEDYIAHYPFVENPD